MCVAFLHFFDDLEEEADDDSDRMETPDPVQTQIPSHPGIKYLVRGIPPHIPRLMPTGGREFRCFPHMLTLVFKS